MFRKVANYALSITGKLNQLLTKSKCRAWVKIWFCGKLMYIKGGNFAPLKKYARKARKTG
jgi:hypothetical protein